MKWTFLAVLLVLFLAGCGRTQEDRINEACYRDGGAAKITHSETAKNASNSRSDWWLIECKNSTIKVVK